MIATDGLGLDQAPPLDLPLRLFLTAPLFAAAAGVLLITSADSILATRWSPAALAVTHLVTVGFLGQVMVGALLQMLPVLVGAPVPGVRTVTAVVHVLLAAGGVLLAAGFLTGSGGLLIGGALGAGLGFGIFGVAILAALARARAKTGGLRGFPLPGIALLVTVALGLVLTFALRGLLPLPGLPSWIDAHVAWGLFGWIGLLVLTVGFQVVPLFHVTPAYPRPLLRALAPALFVVICAASLLPLLPAAAPVRHVPDLLLAAGFGVFAVATLWLQHRRARPRIDATLLHWWFAMAAVFAAIGAGVLSAPAELIGVLLLVGVGIGLPSGMLMKIVPFLCWLHLQSRQIALGRMSMRLPHMHRLLPDQPARRQAMLHGAALLLICAGLLHPALARVGGLALTLSSLWLLAMLVGATRTFVETNRALRSPAPLAPDAAA